MKTIIWTKYGPLEVPQLQEAAELVTQYDKNADAFAELERGATRH